MAPRAAPRAGQRAAAEAPVAAIRPGLNRSPPILVRARGRSLAILLAPMDPLGTIVERLCAWKDVARTKADGKDSFLVRGQVFAYLGKKGVVVKLAPPQVTEALKIIGAKRQPDDGDPHSREFVEIPVNGPREVERAMMWLRRACRLGRTAAGPV